MLPALNNDETSCLLFSLEGINFSVDTSQVVAIIEPPAITELPVMPPYVLGGFSFRGHAALAVDSRALMHLKASNKPPRNAYIVTHIQDDVVAFEVDRMLGIFPKETLESGPSFFKAAGMDIYNVEPHGMSIGISFGHLISNANVFASEEWQKLLEEKGIANESSDSEREESAILVDETVEREVEPEDAIVDSEDDLADQIELDVEKEADVENLIAEEEDAIEEDVTNVSEDVETQSLEDLSVNDFSDDEMHGDEILESSETEAGEEIDSADSNEFYSPADEIEAKTTDAPTDIADEIPIQTPVEADDDVQKFDLSESHIEFQEEVDSEPLLVVESPKQDDFQNDEDYDVVNLAGTDSSEDAWEPIENRPSEDSDMGSATWEKGDEPLGVSEASSENNVVIADTEHVSSGRVVSAQAPDRIKFREVKLPKNTKNIFARDKNSSTFYGIVVALLVLIGVAAYGLVFSLDDTAVENTVDIKSTDWVAPSQESKSIDPAKQLSEPLKKPIAALAEPVEIEEKVTRVVNIETPDFSITVDRPQAKKESGSHDQSLVLELNVQRDATGNSDKGLKVQTSRYEVKAGDTLWSIAKQFLENPFRYPELAENSGIKNPDLIFPKDIVTITHRKAL